MPWTLTGNIQGPSGTGGGGGPTGPAGGDLAGDYPNPKVIAATDNLEIRNLTTGTNISALDFNKTDAAASQRRFRIWNDSGNFRIEVREDDNSARRRSLMRVTGVSGRPVWEAGLTINPDLTPLIQHLAGTTETSAATVYAQRFQATRAVNLFGISCWFRLGTQGTATRVRAYIYSDNAGAVGSLLRTSVNDANPADMPSVRQVDFAFPAQAVTANTFYWVVFEIDGTGTIVPYRSTTSITGSTVATATSVSGPWTYTTGVTLELRGWTTQQASGSNRIAEFQASGVGGMPPNFLGKGYPAATFRSDDGKSVIRVLKVRTTSAQPVLDVSLTAESGNQDFVGGLGPKGEPVMAVYTTLPTTALHAGMVVVLSSNSAYSLHRWSGTAWEALTTAESVGTVTLATGWAHYLNGFDMIKCIKQGRMVTLTGLMRTDTDTVPAGTTIATLPTGFRPVSTIIASTWARYGAGSIYGNPIRLNVASNGAISASVDMTDVTENWVSLTGISFPNE